LYYQGNRTVDNYLDSFLILTSDAGYIDPRTLVVKFHCGLKLNVQSQITTMPFGQPTDTNLEAWYTAAQRIDQAWLANEAFQSMLWMTTSASSRSTPPWSTSLSMFCSPQPAPPPIPPRFPPPTPSGGIPMDIDVVRKMCSLPLYECYQCGETNYLVKDCPHHLDV